IHGIIKQAEAVKGHMHHATLVDNAIDLLRPLVLILIDHQLRATTGSLPVDTAIVITPLIRLDVLEFIAVAYSSDFLDPELPRCSRDRLQLKFFHLQYRRINRDHLSTTLGDTFAYKPEWRTYIEINISKPI